MNNDVTVQNVGNESAQALSERRQLYAEQVKLLYEQGPVGFVATLVTSMVLVLVLWGAVSRKGLVVWVACLILVTLARYVFVYRYRQAVAERLEPTPWGRRFIIGAAASGVVWGSAAIFMFPRDPAHQVFLAFVMGGMVAGAVSVFSSMKRAFLAFSLPVVLPINVQFLIQGGHINITMGFMISLFALLMVVAAWRVNRITLSSLKLGLENTSLVERVAMEKVEVERLNEELRREIRRRQEAKEALQKSHDELEHRVMERTSKLMGTNEQLRQEIEERKRAEASLRESTRRLEVAHDQAIVYGQELQQEVVERKKAQEGTQRAKEDWERTFDAITDMVMLLDDKHKILRINDAGAKALNATKEGLVGKKCYEAVHKTSRPIGGCPLVATMNTLEPQDKEIIEPRLGGTFICSTSPIVNPDGDLTGYTHSLKDITESKRLEAQLQHAQRMEAIGTLAGGIAHDFNNVLMGISGHASLISLYADPDRTQMAHIQGIGDMVERGAELSRQLLGFARGGKYEVVPTDLNGLIEKSCEMFGRTRKEINIHKRYQKDIWAVEVDQTQIEQVLLNLYVNAWQAMPHGGDLYVETSNVVLDAEYAKPFNLEPGNYVRISVTDTGVGMDQDTRQRVFDPFFTTKEVGRGTGLGLSSAYGIIVNHRGIINVYSEKGKGSTFNIYLPVSGKEVIQREEGDADEILRGAETVLLVDDEAVILQVGEQMLKEMGYTVLVARSGKDAVETFTRNKDEIDLVILDMIMPDMGGGEAYDKIKQADPEVKVLLSSGYSVDGQATDILDRGCHGFIQKPFSIKALSSEIREVLDKK